jgi:nucleoside 2-deoxyribosyltransferase
MKIFVAFKFKEDYSDKTFVESVCGALEKSGLETIVMVRDFEKWGEVVFTPGELMRLTFEAIDSCDIHLVEFSEKGVGLGIEAGYAYAKGKLVIVVAKEGSEISTTIKGIAKQVLFYKDVSEIGDLFKDLKM